MKEVSVSSAAGENAVGGAVFCAEAVEATKQEII
jgi:hypothetical protein